MENNKDLYFVAVKIFLQNKEGQLLIIKDIFGDWDLPGGRLKPNDFDLPLEKVLERKIIEELGKDMHYDLDEKKIFMRHERDEVLDDNYREKRRIFAIGYTANYLTGDIKLGNNHKKFEWVDKNFKAEDYFKGGWLKGINEYLKSHDT